MFESRAWFEANPLIPNLCFGLRFEAVSLDPLSILFGFPLDETELGEVLQ